MNVRRNGIAILALGILAGCSGSPPSGGIQQHVTQPTVTQPTVTQPTVTGKFVRVGGPAPGSPVPLPGTITARAATGQTFTARAGSNGRFTLSLPPGTYRVSGRSPLIQSGQMVCGATALLRVSPKRPAGRVTVVCSVS
jgi:hypothetical protein